MKLPPSISSLFNDIDNYTMANLNKPSIHEIIQFLVNSWKTTVIDGFWDMRMLNNKYSVNISQNSICLSEIIDSGYMSWRDSKAHPHYTHKTIIHIFGNTITYHSTEQYGFITIPFCTSEEEFFMQSTVTNMGTEFDAEGMQAIKDLWDALLGVVKF